MEKEVKLSTGKTIKMREPKLRDMKIAGEKKNKIDEELTLIGNLSGLSPDEVEDLTMKDYSSLQKALKDFLEYVSAIKELPANNINFILNGPERNRTIRLIELVVGDGFIDYIEDIINRMYYILYKSPIFLDY